jgi:hypothetical protein
MTMNALILSRFQAVQIAEVLRRVKQRHLLHFVWAKRMSSSILRISMAECGLL